MIYMFTNIVLLHPSEKDVDIGMMMFYCFEYTLLPRNNVDWRLNSSGQAGLGQVDLSHVIQFADLWGHVYVVIMTVL